MNQRVSPETIQVNTRVPSLSLYFDFDRAELTPWAFRSLKGFVEACGDNRSFHLEILGYADAVGSDDYNRHLSRKRADTVARRLRESGIEVPMKAEGRGKLPRSGENGGMLTNESARRVEIYKLEAK
jgi:outer membrane protein OmpA-like peptidoglycan-associated protein